MEAQVSETRRIHRGILGGGSGQEAGRVGWLWSWSLELHWLWKWHKGSQEEEQKVTWGSTSDKWKQSGVFELALMIRWAAKCVRAPATPGLCRATLRTQETKTQAGSTEKYHTQSPNHDMNGNTQGEQQTVHTTVWPQGRRLYRATKKTWKHL